LLASRVSRDTNVKTALGSQGNSLFGAEEGSSAPNMQSGGNREEYQSHGRR